VTGAPNGRSANGLRRRPRRAAAAVTWLYAAGFGLSAPAVALAQARTGRLPTFFGLFPLFAGPWSGRVRPPVMAALLLAFFALTLVTAATGLGIWRGSRRAAGANVALVLPEAVFWVGFALPIPWLLAATRVGLVVMALRPPDGSGEGRGRSQSPRR
jgi:hypothetical protein